MTTQGTESLIEICDSLNLVFVTGKGGIGKSLVSAALAQKFQRMGKRVLLVQQAAADHLGPLFGASNVGHEGVEVLSGLTVANFTPGGNFKDFVVKHLKHGSLFESLAGNKMIHGFFTAIPGFGELMLLGRLYYSLNLAPERPDVVIVDSYASGHFMSLMTTPDAVLQSGLAGPITTETQNVKNFLLDKKRCGTIVVGIPEELIVSEMLELIPQLLAKAPVGIKAVVFNRDLTMTAQTLAEHKDSASLFINERVARQKRAVELWMSMTHNTPLANLALSWIPELGFIDEPLTDDIVDRIVDNGRGVP